MSDHDNSFKAADQADQNKDQGDQGKNNSNTFDKSDKDKGKGAGDEQLSTEELKALFNKSKHQDAHIDKIQGENSDLRGMLQELIDLNTSKVDADKLLEEKHSKDEAAENSSVNPQEVAKLAIDLMSEDQKEKTKGSNLLKVSTALKEEFGDNIDSEADRIARKNGLTFDQLFELAKISPELVLGLSGVKSKAPAANMQGSYNTSSFDEEPKSKTVNMMDLQKTSELVRNYQEKLAQHVKNLG